MATKQGDFIIIDYTGKLSDGVIFDTTVEAEAKAAGITSQKTYAPVTICIGQGHVVPGLDKALVGREPGKFTVTVTAEEGFGRKSAKLLKLTPLRQFKAQKVQPQVGMEVEIDGQYGIVRSVSGGRVIVDYNHPLASQDLTYEIELKAIVTDLHAQSEAMLRLIGIPYDKLEVEKKHVIITFAQLPGQHITDLLHKELTSVTAATQVSFQTPKKSTDGPQKKE